MVGFKKSLISSTVAPEKDLTDTFCRPVDSSQPLTYLNMEAPATTTDVFVFGSCCSSCCNCIWSSDRFLLDSFVDCLFFDLEFPFFSRFVLDLDELL
jgi:hypothetical protein